MSRFVAMKRSNPLSRHTLAKRVRRAAMSGQSPGPRMERLAEMAFSYPALKRERLRRSHKASFTDRLAYDAFPRPHYAYGVYYAASQAKALGIGAISVYEFGVGFGFGLIELERVAAMAERETGVSIDVYGFDTGAGLPEPIDYRDLPHIWQPTFYQMDVDKVAASLTRAKLVLGDVRETVPEFSRTENPARVGFVAVDVDYYSSTMGALRLFDAHEDSLLPRVYCYFDDVIGSDEWEIMCEYIGQLLAIEEFNEQHDTRKLSKIHCLSWKRRIAAPWNEQMYVMHAFDHSLYCNYANPKPKLWKLEDAADPVGMSTDQVYALVSQGQAPAA